MTKLPTNPATRHVVLYFQVHQPVRLRKFRFFDIGSGGPYFDDELNKNILERVALECYLPANSLLLKVIRQNPQVRVAFSISGVTLEMLNDIAPEVVYSFRALAETGSVEFLAETNYHSLACLTEEDEFETQVMQHRQIMEKYLGVSPAVFRNTELIYNNDVGTKVFNLGFKGILCDGAERVIGYRSCHHLYEHPDNALKILLRNYRLSDDIAFRFMQSGAKLSVDQYLSWISGMPPDQSLVTLGLDYETFGEHQKRSTGILTFLQDMLLKMAKHEKLRMLLPSQAVVNERVKSKLTIPYYVSWADQARDLSAWLGNAMQQDAFNTLRNLETMAKTIGDPLLLKCWRMLQTSDHFYYMCTKKNEDGIVHAYFSPYPSPYEAFINYMNVLSDFALIVKRRHKTLQRNNESLTQLC